MLSQSFDMQWSPYHDFEPSDRYPEKQAKKIGYLWGGQLGQLSAVAAQKQWFDTVVFTAEWKNCPSAQVSEFVEITYNDVRNSVEAILDSWVDVVTAEWENVPAKLARAIEEAGIDMYPNWRVYDLVQDRETEKNAVIDCFDGDRDMVIEFAWSITSEDELRKAFKDIWPGRLKTAGGWYDGKWQVKITSEEDLDEYIENVRAQQQDYSDFLREKWWDITDKDIANKKKSWKYVDFDDQKCIFEKELPSEMFELSVMVARSSNGDIAVFDPAYNKHEKGILTDSIVPAWEAWDKRVTPENVEKAKQIAIQLTERYWCKEWIVGLVGVELFVLPDGSIKVNEIAPRPHNSGHPTEYSHNYSQYELLSLAIAGKEFPELKLVQKVHLENMLEDEVLSIEGTDEKTWTEWRLEDKSYGRYIKTFKDIAKKIITIDYGKGKWWFLKWMLDEDEVKGQRKRWHKMEITELDTELLEDFKEAA